MVIRICILSLIVLFSISCSYRSKRSDISSPTIISYNPALNHNFAFSITSETSSSQEVAGKKVENVNKLNYDIFYKVNKDSLDHYITSITYKNFKLTTNVGGNEVTLDANEAVTASIPSERILGALKDAEFVLTIDSLGHVLSISGLEELHSKMKDLAKGGAEALRMIDNSGKSYLNEGMVKQIAAGCMAPFIGDSLFEGKKWTDSSIVQAPVKMPVKNQYEVEALDSTTAVLIQQSDINFENQHVEVDHQKAIASFSGNQEGKIEIDVRTGLIINSQTELQLKGKISLMGVQMPVEITTNTSVKRLN